MYNSTYLRYLEEANSEKQKVEGYQKLGRGRNEELFFLGYRTSVRDDDKVLKMDSGDSCTILRMNLMTLNLIL